MKIPRKINIKGSTWKIVKKVDVIDDDGNECLGLCAYAERVIYLEKSMDKNMVLEVLFHEFLHALTHEIHLDLGPKAEDMLVEAFTQEIMKNFKLRL